MSELQEDGRQGERDEETGGETGQVGGGGEAGGVPEPSNIQTLSLQLEPGEGIKESFTETDEEQVKNR